MLNDKPSQAAVKLRLQWLTITPFIRTMILSILILINIAVLGIFTMATVKLLQERRSYINALEALGNPAPLITPGAGLIKPQTLILQSQGALTYSIANGIRHDIYAALYNPNTDWIAYLRFRFVGEGYEGPWQSMFVPPGEDMYLTSLGIITKQPLQNLKLDIDDIRFQRAKDYQQRKNIWLPLRMENLTTTAAGNTSLTTFTVNNLGPSSLATLPFILVALQQGAVTGISTLTVQQVPAFSTREVSLRWSEPLSPQISLRILPLINVYDIQQFLTPQNPVQTF